jgi:acid phosphatase class B
MHPRRIPWIVLACAVPAALARAARSASSVAEPTPQPAASTGRTITVPQLQATVVRRPRATAVSDIDDTTLLTAIGAIRIIQSPVSDNEHAFSPGRYGEEILANSAD